MVPKGPDDIALLSAAARSLFKGPVGLGVNDPRAAQPDLYPAEAAYVVGARPERKQEFAAGRSAARQAMIDLGGVQAPVPAASDRSPIWPEGLVGSITHAQSVCVAVVSKDARSIGIDLETTDPLDADLISTICSDAELARIAGRAQQTLAKLIFCAKEAAYKAQYPLTKALFGFEYFDVTLNLKECTFRATFTASAGEFDQGAVLHGKFAQVAGHFLTAVTLDGPLTTGT
jgi:4'-phosphopantetheinyl transferase EntD